MSRWGTAVMVGLWLANSAHAADETKYFTAQLYSPDADRSRIAEGELRRIGPSAFRTVLASLKRPEASGRRRAATLILDWSADEKLFRKYGSSVVRATDDDDALVRARLGAALLRCQRPHVAALSRLLTTRHEDAREAAAAALAKLGEPAYAPVEKLILTNSAKRIVGACIALRAMKTKAARFVPRVTELTAYKDPRVRIAAIRALAAIEVDKKVVMRAALKMIDDDDDPAVRSAAAGCARDVGELILPELWTRVPKRGDAVADALAALDRTLVPAIVGKLDPDNPTRTAVILNSLARRDPMFALDPALTETLSKFASHADVRVRRSCYHLLAICFFGRPQELSKLAMAGLVDKDATVRAHAFALVARWEGRAAWDSDKFGGHPKCDIGVTALALLAYSAGGITESHPKYGDVVRLALTFLLGAQQKDGLLGTTTNPKYVLQHAMALAAIAEHELLSGDKRLLDPIRKALEYAESARNKHLGWRYAARSGENDTFVTGWMIYACWLGHSAIPGSPPYASEGAMNWLEKMTDSEFGQVGYNVAGGSPADPLFRKKLDTAPPQPTSMAIGRMPMVGEYRAVQSMTALAMWTRALLVPAFAQDKIFKGGQQLVLEYPPEWNARELRIDLLYWMFGARLLTHTTLNNRSRQWLGALKSTLLDHASPMGGWEPDGTWGNHGGRVYSTAVGTMALLGPIYSSPDHTQLNRLRAAVTNALKSKHIQVSRAAIEALGSSTR